MSADRILEVEALTVDYHTPDGDVRVVDEVSFEVGRREIVGLVGESGSGKSAIVHAVSALPRSVLSTLGGAVRLDGIDVLNPTRADLRRLHGTTLGFVGQNPFGSLHPTLTIARQFHDVLKAHKRTASRRQSREIAEAALEQVGIREAGRVLSGYANQLSGGMAQRVVIAIAAVLRPKLFIADEPTTALDPTVQIQILDVLAGLRDALGMSILIVTHDLGVVANYCERMLVMRAGTLVEQGTIEKLFREPEHPYTRELLRSDDAEGAE